MDKNTIYNSFLLLAEQQQKLLQNAQQLNDCFYNFFKGATDSKQNTNKNMPIISLEHKQGDELMKFQGKTIHKNTKCNTWYTRYRANGKQYYISGKSQREVLTILKEKLNYVKKEIKQTTTLFDWYNQWLRLFKIGIVKDATLKDYTKTLKNVSDEILNKDITKIKSIEIQTNLNEITHERTRQKTFELLNALFFKAEQHKIINDNIMNIIEKPKHKRERGISLNSKQKTIFINECINHKYGNMYLITMYQGLRIGEILALTGNDIDFENKKITINKALNHDNKIDTTKNEQSIRTIPIFDNTLKILDKYKNYKEKRLFNFSYNVPQKHLKEILENCNLPKEISLHDLRHTFISTCKNKGIPEHIVQYWVGHKIGSKVTSQIYTHINEEDSLLYLEKYNNTI